tara:strand:- start:4006 stop:4209 length:204 start_codon:yes stop_codon:yes gene_type:complete
MSLSVTGHNPREKQGDSESGAADGAAVQADEVFSQLERIVKQISFDDRDHLLRFAESLLYRSGDDDA